MKKTEFLLSIVFFCVIFIAVCLVLGFVAEKAIKRQDTRKVSLSADEFSVIIDAGHGGEDGGAVGEDGITFEKDVNLAVSLYLGQLLKAEGVNVIFTRTEDVLLYDRNVDYQGRKKALDLKARLETAQKYPDAVFVSIHMNAFTDKRYSGMQVYYSDSDESGKQLAALIQDMAMFLSPSNDRKIKNGSSSIYLLEHAPGTAVLVECGFLSNPEECGQLSSEAYQKKVAFSVFRGIMDYKDGKSS